MRDVVEYMSKAHERRQVGRRGIIVMCAVLLTKRFAYLFQNSSLIFALQDIIHSALDGFGDLVNVLRLNGSLNKLGEGGGGGGGGEELV